ncbi:unnamed protein product [Acanthoscelides obtectus]|uniref:Uncharacterized protein n=1 Tax=Acanthoscelides obtectus TaxID=200917 RepID=A0A9P0KP22_ACAOB|nr:unnamed protein product [Acanthoscelides obtectus]CAK1639548.1 hypothetical protein AOBTE_LOCUS11240 [Acanthoscelides obtectus]
MGRNLKQSRENFYSTQRDLRRTEHAQNQRGPKKYKEIWGDQKGRKDVSF